MDRYGRQFHRDGELCLRELRLRGDGGCFLLLDRAWLGTYARHGTVRVAYGDGEALVYGCDVPYDRRFEHPNPENVRRVARDGRSLGLNVWPAWVRRHAVRGVLGAVYDPHENCYRLRPLTPARAESAGHRAATARLPA